MSGVHTLHLLVQIAGNCLILKCFSVRKFHLISFCWCFSYLTFFRLSSRLGLPDPPPHTNAIILILTLKLVGLAFEIHDSANESDQVINKDSGDTKVKEEERLKPSVTDTIHYCLGHIGLITGPYYKYRTWQGLYKDDWNPAVTGTGTVCEQSALTRAKNVPLYVLLFLASGYLFPLSAVETKEWQESSGVLWKLFYMMPIFFNFRYTVQICKK